MTDQFSLPNTQYMISSMATMGFYSKPLLDICSNTITGNIIVMGIFLIKYTLFPTGYNMATVLENSTEKI